MISALLLLAGQAAAAVPDRIEPSVREALASGEAYVLVALDVDLPERGDERARRIEEARGELLADLPEESFRPVYLWRNVAGLSGWVDADGLQLLARHPRVARVGTDLAGAGELGTSVPFIGAPQAHSGGTTGQGWTVVVIDSGVDSDHPDLVADLVPGAMHFLDQGATVGQGAEDELGHGTAVATTITSDGVIADLGVAPDAGVLPLQVVDSSGQSFLSDWVAAVDHVVSLAAQRSDLAAINMSLASNVLFTESPCDATTTVNMLLGDAIDAARALGIPTFASSGNDGSCTSMGSPACLGSAVAVAAVYEADNGREPIVGTYQNFFGPSFSPCFDATTQGDQIACFSNRSDSNALAAPGRSIVSGTLAGGVGTWTGTSQAAPHATGAFVLVRAGTEWPAETCLRMLAETGKPTTDPCASSTPPVRVDVAAALDASKAFQSFCFGDGGDQMGCTACPCANDAAQGSRGGCLNSAGTSARLAGSGHGSVSDDTLRFDAEDLPPTAATLLVSGVNRLPSNPAHPCFTKATGIPTFGDGLRCTGGTLVRHGLRFSDAAGGIGLRNSGWGGDDAPAVGILARAGFTAGQTRHFQGFYRDLPHTGCSAGLDSTQGVTLTFVP